MKQIALFVMVLAFELILSNNANAQKDDYRIKTPEEKADARTKIMTCEMSLTKEEIPKVYAINLGMAKSMDSAMKIWQDHPGRMKAFGTKLDKKRDVAMRHVMTADHYSYYLRLIDGETEVLKATAPCRQGSQIW